jgi:hypothetical protein
LIAARPPGVVIPPVPQTVAGPDGTLQVVMPSQPLPRAPVLGDQSVAPIGGKRSY